jgi:hypothetical protein
VNTRTLDEINLFSNEGDIMADEYITIIGESYLDPIVKLFEQLKDKSTFNEVQTSPYENGYSTSIIVLTAMMLESFLARARHFRHQEGCFEFDKSVIKYIEKNFKLDGNIILILNELFVTRDVIAHNHVWKSVINHNRGLTFVSDPYLEELYGDKKFRMYVDMDRRKTKKLGLNIFPTKICKLDAIVYFENSYKVLTSIENLSRKYLYFSHFSVVYKEKEHISIEEFVSILKEEVDFI